MVIQRDATECNVVNVCGCKERVLRCGSGRHEAINWWSSQELAITGNSVRYERQEGDD